MFYSPSGTANAKMAFPERGLRFSGIGSAGMTLVRIEPPGGPPAPKATYCLPSTAQVIG